VKLVLQQVRFKNFFSFGNNWITIDLNTDKTTLMVGKNGSGKSSAILDAISFVLFNKPFRNIRKPQIINSINNKQCLVELDFMINGFEFMVRRGLKPNVFEIYKNGELINQTADNRDYQDAFEKYILRVNHKTFCQIVMLGSAIFTPFMSLPALQRREVIEDLLDLKIFSTMNSLLKKNISDVEKQVISFVNQRNILNERHHAIKESLNRLQTSRDEFIATRRQWIQSNEEQKAVLATRKELYQSDVEKLNQQLSDIKSIEARH